MPAYAFSVVLLLKSYGNLQCCDKNRRVVGNKVQISKFVNKVNGRTEKITEMRLNDTFRATRSYRRDVLSISLNYNITVEAPAIRYFQREVRWHAAELLYSSRRLQKRFT